MINHTAKIFLSGQNFLGKWIHSWNQFALFSAVSYFNFDILRTAEP
jgi:hypothetical protein